MPTPYEPYLDLLIHPPQPTGPVTPPILPTIDTRSPWLIGLPPIPTAPSVPTTPMQPGPMISPALSSGGAPSVPRVPTPYVPARPEQVIPDYPYEYEGLPGEVSMPGPGPTSPAPRGKQWAVRWFESPTGGGNWGWVLVDAGTPSRQAQPVAPVPPPPGGGGGGGGGVTPTPAPAVEPLGELSWWGPEQVPPLLRNWATWLRELVEINALTNPVPIPFSMAEKEGAGITTGPIEQVTTETLTPTGYHTPKETINEIQTMLGLQFTEGTSPTEMWQAFISKIPQASLEVQQRLSGLRYDANRGWYIADVNQLVNPAYI